MVVAVFLHSLDNVVIPFYKNNCTSKNVVSVNVTQNKPIPQVIGFTTPNAEYVMTEPTPIIQTVMMNATVIF
jgi:hypothetical protein